MSIEKDIKDLDHEIQELYNYVSVDEQEKLNKIASWFLPAGIIAGIMGMNAFSEDTMLFKGDTINWSAWGWVGIAILLSIFVAFMTTKLVSIKIKRSLCIVPICEIENTVYNNKKRGHFLFEKYTIKKLFLKNVKMLFSSHIDKNFSVSLTRHDRPFIPMR